MARVSGQIPNLVNGVSQQPPALRLATQADLQVNCYSTVVKGLTNRPPVEHIARIADVVEENAFVHIINRDVDERYVLVATSTNLRVFDFAGNEKTVNFPNGKAYLSTLNPAERLAALTVADYTFLINKDKVVGKLAALSPDYGSQGLVVIRSGNYGRTYRLYVDGTLKVSLKTPDGSLAAHTSDIDTTTMADIMVKVLTGVTYAAGASTVSGTSLGTGWTVSRNNSTIYIKKNDGTAFTLKVEDGQNGNAMFAIKDATAQFEDLPLYGFQNFHVKIQGRSASGDGDYYALCQSNEQNVWKESLAEGIQTSIDPMTMPFSLVREANGSFTFRQNTWNSREVGDDNSNPFSSFVGRSINDVFFHKNRLGFLSDENCILSSGGDYFKYWRTTVLSLLDDDPIDIAASHDKVSILRSAIPYQENLLLFSDQTQFRLEGGDILTPQTASLPATTEFQASTKAKPVGAGTSVFFAVEKNDYSAIQEYFVDSDTRTNDARDVTAHVPEYVPAGIFKLAATSNESVLVVLSKNDQDSLYIYKYLYDDAGQAKLQSSWSRWDFPNVIRIHSFAFIQSDLYWVVTRTSGVFLEKITFEQGVIGDDDLGFRIHLDQKIRSDNAKVTKSYNATTNQTTFTFPFVWKSMPKAVVSVPVNYDPGYDVEVIGDPASYNSNKIILEGDFRSETMIFGTPYECLYDLSIFQIRQESTGGGISVVSEGRLQVQRLTLQYANSGYFEVIVKPTGRLPWVYNPNSYMYGFNGRNLGEQENLISAPAIDTGEYQVPIFSRNDRVKITIRSDSHLPFCILSAEWIGLHVMKSKRVS
ncbi:hypothetical protein [Hyphomicrobium sp. ghe19]|uniref:phage nozzle protein n=1 Tax=Hyphomicrobium sp. ghe19 TaxID=2682968 RepID=UPI001366A235|nr:hypothetical protein HYPP_02629 [Hyphomicrobium sp. ghe19]